MDKQKTQKTNSPEEKKAESVSRKNSAQTVRTDRKKAHLRDFGYVCIVLGVIAVLILFCSFVLDPVFRYFSAGKAAKEGNVEEAMSTYEELGGFLFSRKKLEKLSVDAIDAYYEQGEYKTAISLAEQKGVVEELAEENPDLLYQYGKQRLDSGNTDDAVKYLAMIPDYEDAAYYYDIAAVEEAIFQAECYNYDSAVELFDSAESLEWMATLDLSVALTKVNGIAAFSYRRASLALEQIAAQQKQAATWLEKLNAFVPYCGEKKCISDTGNEGITEPSVFDFFENNDSEYMSVDGQVFAKDTDGTYFSLNSDMDAGLTYSYRFALSDNGSILETYTISGNGEESENTRIWE